MRVIAIRTKLTDCPAEIAALGSPQSDLNITLHNKYEIHALSVYRGIVFLQLVGDAGIIMWLPAWLFKVDDNSIPEDWVCSLPGNSLQSVLGPRFVADDESSYNRMVEQNMDSVAAFWQRVEAKSRGER